MNYTRYFLLIMILLIPWMAFSISSSMTIDSINSSYFTPDSDFPDKFDFGIFPGTDNDSLLYLSSLVGLKHYLIKKLFLDFYIGHDIRVCIASNYPDFTTYWKDGFRYELKLKLLMN